MKTKDLKQISLFILLFCSTYYSQQFDSYYSPTVVDTRSFAMGNTQILSANGSNALFSNPAILSTLDKIQVQTDIRAFWGNFNIEKIDDLDAGYSLYPKVTNISIAVPIKTNNNNIKFALAGGYSNFLDWSWDYYNKNYGSDEKIMGGINMLSFAFSVNFFSSFNIAVSYNTSLYAKMNQEYFTTKEETNYKNVSFSTISIYANPFSNFKIGAFIRPKYEIGLDSYNRTTEDGYEEYESDFIQEMPIFWGIGIGYNFSSNVVVNAEYQNRPYGEINDSYENGKCIRIGSEIKTNFMPIRVGFLLEDILANKQFVKDSPVTMFGITLGTGYNFSQNLAMDMGFQFNRYRNENTDFGLEEIGKSGPDLFKLSLGASYKFD